jgi:hypothetical protein
MKKQKPPEASLHSEPIDPESIDIHLEMLYAAAEAHPDWEVMPDGMGIQHVGSEGPNTPRELLDWFLTKGRH